MGIEFKEMPPEDFKTYVDIRYEAFRKPQGRARETVLQKHESDATVYIGAYDGDRLIGGGFYTDRGNGEALLHQVVITDEYRKKGLGKPLVEAVEALAKENGIKEMYAHIRTYLDAFYEKCGYTNTGLDERQKKEFGYFFTPEVPHHYKKKVLDIIES